MRLCVSKRTTGWLTRRDAGAPPYVAIPNDPLPQRAALHALGNRLAASSSEGVGYFPSSHVAAINIASGAHTQIQPTARACVLRSLGLTLCGLRTQVDVGGGRERLSLTLQRRVGVGGDGLAVTEETLEVDNASDDHFRQTYKLRVFI